MKHTLIGLALLVFAGLLSACTSPTPTATPMPTPDARATETRIALNIFATQTASVPTATNTPTVTSTPTLTPTSTATNTPTITPSPTTTNTPTMTSTPRPTNTPTIAPTPVLQDQPVALDAKWQVTLISVRRDKTIYGSYDAETAFGIWATLVFRVKNLQAGSDYIGKTYDPLLVTNPFTSSAKGVEYKVLNTVDSKAQWFYGCCSSAYSNNAPGQENVVLYVLDVPENTTSMNIGFYQKSTKQLAPPTFFVPNFDQIPPRKTK